MSNMSPDIIKWPNEAEKRISEVYFRRNGFPNVIGVIDGTHIKIDKPDNDPDSYINRKGHRLSVIINKIINLFVGYPGSVHDSRVLRNSFLFRDMKTLYGPYLILGDSGYSLLRNLMTPFKNRGQLTRVQSNFNYRLYKK